MQKIKIISADNYTPLSLARKLKARVILESSSYQKGRSRYSLLMIDEAFTLIQEGDRIFLRYPGKKKEKSIKSSAKDILDLLNYFANQHRSLHQDFPYPTGGIGFCSFEFSRYCDTINMPPKPDELNIPDAAFIFGHSFIIFDHYTDQLYLIALNYKEKMVDLENIISSLEERIENLNFTYLQPDEKKYEYEEIDQGDQKKQYSDMVDYIRSEIIAGNLLQAVPSRRRRFKTNIPAIAAYRLLRQMNPSPYLFYLDFEEYQLFGASPELHLKVKEGKLYLRPIAGTRRRGENEAEDKALEQELLADAKEIAEHLMLVDLGRNDLGRVAQAHTVRVSENMVIERYSRVMHIVSQIEADLEQGKSGIDALRASFPAGTVSGAPKIRAIETIHKLESVTRSFYAGIVGYLEPGADLETCITIRSALYKDGILSMQAGGGVVYDSKSEREFEETNEKMSALLHAIGLID